MPRKAPVDLLLGLLLAGALVVGAAAPASAAYPTLPASDGGQVLSNLSAPVLAPGSSGAFGFRLANPLAGPMTSVTLSFGFYSFVAFPGNASAVPPTGETPTFSGPGTSGTNGSITLASLAAGSSFDVPDDERISVSAPGGAPDGTFALRFALSFTEGSVAYRFESRGFFSDAQWANATLLPNGASTLNLTRLGVSGVLPETAVLVRADTITPILYGILAASLVLAAAGGYVAWRRGPGSRSGERPAPRPQSAPSAFGKSRTSDGD